MFRFVAALLIVVMPLAASAQQGMKTADPEKLVRMEVEQMCSQMGGTVTYHLGFVRAPDLDGDGRRDMVLDLGAAVCDAAASLYCGSGGCSTAFYRAVDGGYIDLYRDTIRGWEIAAPGQVRLHLHGNACGLVGAEPCEKTVRVGVDRFFFPN